MPTFTPDERLRYTRLAQELKTYGLVQYYERRAFEARQELLKVRFFIGELTDTQYWMYRMTLDEMGLREYARFHDGHYRAETYYGERVVDQLRAATEGFDIDVADLQPAHDQAGLHQVSPLVE